MVDQTERNRLLANEFRRNGGVVAEEKFKDALLLLLTTTGRSSGRNYVNPLRYLPDGDRLVVFASHQGAEVDPDWFKNLMASGEAIVEVGRERFEVRAQVIDGEERESLIARQTDRHAGFSAYRTSRMIPVVALYRK